MCAGVTCWILSLQRSWLKAAVYPRPTGKLGFLQLLSWVPLQYLHLSQAVFWKYFSNATSQQYLLLWLGLVLLAIWHLRCCVALLPLLLNVHLGLGLCVVLLFSLSWS